MTAITLRTAFRHRRLLLASLCAVLALGVVVHHAMPEAMPPMASMPSMGHTDIGGHHAKSAMEMCLALAGIGGLLLLAARARWRPYRPTRACFTAAPRFVLGSSASVHRTRAGPSRSVVLRL